MLQNREKYKRIVLGFFNCMGLKKGSVTSIFSTSNAAKQGGGEKRTNHISLIIRKVASCPETS